MPSRLDTQRFSVRNPNGPTVPFACWYDGPYRVRVAGAQHGLVVDLERAADSRARCCCGPASNCQRPLPSTPTKTSPPRRSGNCGTCVASGERAVRIEVVHPIVPLGARRLVVVAQPEVQREPLADAPVVLDVRAEVEVLRGDVLPVLNQGVVLRPGAEQQRRDGCCRPCCWRCWDWAPASSPGKS